MASVYKVTVNPVLDVDQYPLPTPDDIFTTLAGGKLFTTLDLTHVYNQLLLDEESQKYVTELHQRQRTMDSILQGVEGVACYIDNIIITGKFDCEHLEEVLKRLLRHGVRVKRSKCRFLQPSVTFLGHRIDAEGIYPLDGKLKAIVKAPAPENVQELCSFLGLINYYSTSFEMQLQFWPHSMRFYERKPSGNGHKSANTVSTKLKTLSFHWMCLYTMIRPCLSRWPAMHPLTVSEP